METSSPDPGDPQLYLAILNSILSPGPGDIFLLVIMLLLIAVSAFISGSEVAFFSLSKGDLATIEKNQEDKAENIRRLLAKPQQLLATILISNNLVNVSIIVISYFLFNALHFENYPYLGDIINIGVVTLILVLFGEVIPKVYASHNNISMAVLMSSPLIALRLFFSPAASLLVSSTNIIERRLQRLGNPELNADELEQAIDLTSGSKSSKEEVSMLKGIINFGNIQVKQIMKPRVDIVAVEENVDFSELMRSIRESGYSRIPVYKENMDTITGILYVKDLLEFLDKPVKFKWQELIRDAYFIPAGKKIDDVLKEMQEKRVHMVIAVDEYGGTAGIVTLEDILEEVIGDIKDEYDAIDEIEFEQIDDRNYLFKGKTLINDICKVLKVKDDTFEEVRGESDSLAGLVLELSGRIPEPNDILTYHQYQFTVVAVENNRIEQVKLTINEVDETDY